MTNVIESLFLDNENVTEETYKVGAIQINKDKNEYRGAWWNVINYQACDTNDCDMVVDEELAQIIDLYKDENDKNLAEAINEVAEAYGVEIYEVVVGTDYYYDFNPKTLYKSFKAELMKGSEGMTQSVCESRNCDKVVKILRAENDEISVSLYLQMNNGNVWGCYYKDGEIVMEDIWGEIHENITV